MSGWPKPQIWQGRWRRLLSALDSKRSPATFRICLENFTERASDVQAAGLGDAGQRANAVIKSYPTTTHKEMIEYRVSKKQTISDLYAHLEQTFIDYHAAELVEGQRPQTITEVNVESSQ